MVKKWSKQLIEDEEKIANSKNTNKTQTIQNTASSLWDKMKKVTNYTHTENNALTYKSTGSDLLNLFATGGSMRKLDDKTIKEKISRALAEDFVLGVKCLFYLRDVRKGCGERRMFRLGLEVISEMYNDKAESIIPCVIEYGRFDDIFSLQNVNIKDYILENINKNALIPKWMPSENAGKKSKLKAKALRKYLGLKSVQYRKMLSVNRIPLNLVETNLSKKEYTKIEYEAVPSKAMLKYKQTFTTKDEERYTQYLNDVKFGLKKINTKTIFPHEIVKQAKNSNDETLETLWNNLPDYTKNENAIVVADTSGSMAGTPIDTSIALAIYFAERNKGIFQNKFITFSSNPTLQEIKGVNLYQKITNLSKAHWDMNTDIMKVFNLILNTSLKNNLPQNEIPKTIYIISDMEFDDATYDDNYDTNYEVIKKKYKEAGYELPQLVFWNVDSRNDNMPVTENEYGTILVSGSSPIVFSTVLNKTTPKEHMLKILNSPRYEMVEKCVS